MRAVLMQLLMVALTAAGGPAATQPYPDKSKILRIHVPFGAASSTDVLARALARGITEVAGLNVIVENKPGAEGQIGMSAGKVLLRMDTR